MKESKLYLFLFVRSIKNIFFDVSKNFSSLYMPWDEKGWKSLVYNMSFIYTNCSLRLWQGKLLNLILFLYWFPLCLFLWFFFFLIDFREGGKERHRKRNIHVREVHWGVSIGCLPHTPQLGIKSQPRYYALTWNCTRQPVTFWCTEYAPTTENTGQGKSDLLNINMLSYYFSLSHWRNTFGKPEFQDTTNTGREHFSSDL